MSQDAPPSGGFAAQPQVMSALIKCVRLRRVDDAVYWFSHFIKFWPGERFRLARRILILAGEDCLSTSVQGAVSEWFVKSFNMKDPTTWYRSAVTQLHLICATPDWWATAEGAHYIVAWRKAERVVAKLDDVEKKAYAVVGVSVENPAAALVQHMVKNAAFEDWKLRQVYAQTLADLGRTSDNLSARLTASIHVRHAKSLGKDDNFTGQAIYKLAYGPLGDDAYPKLDPNRIKESVERAAERLKTPEKTPSWTQDGIHCYGKDRRFAGVLSNMVGCCRAYLEHGRLHPDDAHPPEYASTTVVLEKVKSKLPFTTLNKQLP